MSYNFERLKVLVVDDNLHMRTLVTAILQAFGVAAVYDANNADEAWAVLCESRCDIVFVDWEMNGASGLEFTKRVRTAPNSPNPFTSIIMLTGHCSIERVQTARDAGVNEFLAKPVSAKTILARLISLVENPRPFVRTKSYLGPCRRRRLQPYEGPERRLGESGFEFLDLPKNAA